MGMGPLSPAEKSVSIVVFHIARAPLIQRKKSDEPLTEL